MLYNIDINMKKCLFISSELYIFAGCRHLYNTVSFEQNTYYNNACDMCCGY